MAKKTDVAALTKTWQAAQTEVEGLEAQLERETAAEASTTADEIRTSIERVQALERDLEVQRRVAAVSRQRCIEAAKAAASERIRVAELFPGEALRVAECDEQRLVPVVAALEGAVECLPLRVCRRPAMLGSRGSRSSSRRRSPGTATTASF